MGIKFDNNTLEDMNELPERYKYILNDIIKEYITRAAEVEEKERFWFEVWQVEFGDDTCFTMTEYDLLDFDKKYDIGAHLALHLNTDKFLPHFTKYDVLFFKDCLESDVGDYVIVENKIDKKHYIVTHDNGFYETLDSDKIFLPCQVEEYAKLVKIVYKENAPGI